MVAEDSRKYTAFRIEYRKYEFLPVPFGKQVVPSYSAMMINETLKGLYFCFSFFLMTSSYTQNQKKVS